VTQPLPILPTTVVGAYAHPCWLHAAQEWIADGRFADRRSLAEAFVPAINAEIKRLAETAGSSS